LPAPSGSGKLVAACLPAKAGLLVAG